MSVSMGKAGAPERIANLDRLRIAAMADIVAFHAAGEYVLGGMGLPVFLLTSVALSARKREPPALPGWLAKRVPGLLIPFVFWSLVYGLWIVVLNLRYDRSMFEGYHARMLLFGTAIHLWFLPFILVANTVAIIVQTICRKVEDRQFLGVTLVLSLATLAICATKRQEVSMIDPFRQWVFSLPCLPLGLMMGRAISMKAKSTSFLLAVAIAALAVWGLLTFVEGAQWSRWESAMVARYSLGLGAIAFGILIRGKADPFTNSAVTTIFGVYLIHPMLLKVLRTLDVRITPWWFLTLLVFFASMLLTSVIRSTAMKKVV